jgi:dephospho-CoA kinase|tara:strand:- start:52383 stop:52985 length:603 start_codon:yes stop_codon:yes gene_type:complete
MTYAIGLTGSIATGKSTAAAFFERHAIDIISADEIARDLTKAGEPTLVSIVSHFGQGILKKNGELNRRALRNKIIRHPAERLWLEGYLHPQIRARIENALCDATSPYVIIEIPLLVSRENYPYLNRVLLLETESSLQMKRLIARDDCTHDDAIAILNLQPREELRRTIADDVIRNDGNPEHLEEALRVLHQNYLNRTTTA